MSYSEVFDCFEEYKVAYLVAGGMAVNLHGVPRFTKDLDILVDTSKANLNRLSQALKKLGYKPRVPVRLEKFLDVKNWQKWKKEKGMKAFTLFHPQVPFEEIDILTGVSISYITAAKNKVTMRAGRMSIHVVSIEDLIKMKKEAGRQQDWSDIEALRKVKKRIKN